MEASIPISHRSNTFTNSSPSSSAPSLSQSRDSYIRSRLLHRLGIHQERTVMTDGIVRLKRCEHHTIQTKNDPEPFFQPLRDCDGHLLPTAIYPTTFKTSKLGTIRTDIVMTRTRPRSPRVRFNDNVLVVLIPSRHAYSNRIKKAFWRDGNELQDIADRNQYEYISEGSDWNTVLEDEDMYIDVDTGEKVHPCWVENEDDEIHDDLDDGLGSDEIQTRNFLPLTDVVKIANGVSYN
eukprot:CAMPEP_0172369916 /NCGR_PEP_ID=MMETSP1060-20121228/35197_1 /TAXON_ID=37318 /ORGANISM="Pseudo-nitzschia pungens, Strain cf. cingulata" /LENGTH=235 /DNA_ID=CAMNT_0013095007 /DNA_START=28 /DNA_END=735 /DNA_ORIENTATION=+